MTFKDVVEIYEKKKKDFGNETYKYVSQIFIEIKEFFATLDEDEVFQQRFPAKKPRAICEVDTDGCYVLTDKTIASSKKVKLFSEFISDLKKLKF